MFNSGTIAHRINSRYWNPGDLTETPSYFMSLSNTFKTATVTNTTGLTQNVGVRSITTRSTGRYYFEIVADNLVSVTSFGIKSTATSVSLSTGTDVGYYRSDGEIRIGNTTSSTTSMSNGDIIGVGVDLDNGYLWIRRNGTWVNGVTPASNFGFFGPGIVLVPGTYSPFFHGLVSTSGSQGTLRLFSGEFSSLPATLNAWGGS